MEMSPFYDTSPVLDYEDKSALELLTDILQHNQEFSVQAKNLAMEVAGGKEGEAVLVFEIREDQPGRYYLNGRPHTF